MKLLGLDFETTGLDLHSDRIIEVGAVLWDTTARMPIKLYSNLMWDESYPKLPVEITKLTGIKEDVLMKYGELPRNVFSDLHLMMCEAEGIVAHNGNEFDFEMLFEEFERQGKLSFDPKRWDWIDTQTDIEYPEHITVRKLSYLALEHGIMNPFSHRALFDVLTMLAVLDKYDAEKVRDISRSETINIQAQVSFDTKDLAKARGYRWDGDNKRWVKTIREHFLTKEMEAPFKVLVLK